jgi:hypothetical protein
MLIPHLGQFPSKHLGLCQGESFKGHTIEFHMSVTPTNWQLLVPHSPGIMLMQISQLHVHSFPWIPLMLVRILLNPYLSSPIST